jgi:hypothetical protein
VAAAARAGTVLVVRAAQDVISTGDTIGAATEVRAVPKRPEEAGEARQPLPQVATVREASAVSGPTAMVIPARLLRAAAAEGEAATTAAAVAVAASITA